jgi:SAM-dependent methyltransferase
MKKYLQVILVSFTILFLELLLIRLIGTEIRIFAYFSNLLLLCIFIGSGIGMFIRSRISVSLSSILLTLVTLIIITGWMANITDQLAPLSESFFWFQSAQNQIGDIVSGLFMTLLLFLMVLGIFIPLGQILGELLEDTNKIILVYSINIIASLIGMWFFQSTSLFNVSLFWGIIFSQFLLVLLAEKIATKKVVIFCLLLSLVIVAGGQSKTEGLTVWSPYQKLTISSLPKNDFQPEGYILKVNNVGYMGLLDLSDAYKNSVKEKLKTIEPSPEINFEFGDQYALPFAFKSDIQNTLIIGSGGGNDVAAAVRAGVANIDAVEIDPQIIEFGKKYHPEQPYDSKNVSIYVEDGRSFLKRTDKKYDLVIMGLADSHTLTSSLTNVRLDHYLYTKESFEEVKKILKPDGLLFLSFDIRKDWIGSRIQKSLSLAFGAEPLVFNMQDNTIFGWGGVVFVVGNNIDGLNLLGQNPNLKEFITPRILNYSEDINPLTDNWPYLYLDAMRLPKIHLWISFFLILLIFLLKKIMPWRGQFAWDFFFLGAGFLLFEFQNISKTSLLFGNTWITNLFTISFILIFILLANIIQARKPLSLKFAYFALFLSILVQFFVPLSVLNSLTNVNKIIFGSLFLNLPFLFSGMIFITKLNNAKSKSTAFASNLLGATVGGILEIFSFLLGIQSLLIFSLLLYALSLAPFHKIFLLKSKLSLLKD